ncbi:MAG TPA: VCBS repeat-containing protein [Verrucomicrobiae bacterium]|jgi:hypothetical protein
MKPKLFFAFAVPACAMLFASSIAFCQTLSFGIATAPSAGNKFVAAADLNNNGKMDLAAAGSPLGTTGLVTVLTNNGAGAFGSNSAIVLPSEPAGLALADMNGDGKADLIVTTNENLSSGAVLVYANNGNGVFALRNAINLPFSISGLAVGDFNNDGKPDIAVVGLTNMFEGTAFLAVYTNNGAGFGIFFSTNTGFNPTWLTAADVNNDGRMDLIASDGTTFNLRVYTNNGAVFAPFASLPAGNTPITVTAADINNDGKVDLIAANTGFQPTLTVYTNNGNGFGLFSTNAISANSSSIVAADLYHSGQLELVCADSGGSLVVFTNSGTGFASNAMFTAGVGPNEVIAADFNGDGKVDLATADEGSSVQLLINMTHPAKTLAGYSSGTLSAGPSDFPVAVAAADVNNDGNLDLIAASASEFLSVLPNLGGGVFGASFTAPSSGDKFVAAADVNNDGKVDLVAAGLAGAGTGLVTVLTNNGNGAFASNSAIALATEPAGLALADINGDGKVDLIVATNRGASAGAVLVYANNGSGVFGLRNAINLPFSLSGLAVGDFNNDGTPDIAIAGLTNAFEGTAFLAVYTNNGAGFGVFFSTNTGFNPTSLIAADVNNDGRIDLIASDGTTFNLRVYTNNGAGFAPFASLPAGNTPSTVSAADINNDGKVDLIAANSGFQPTLTVYTNNGNGFRLFSTNATAGNPVSIIAADLNHNGILSLVCADSSDANLELFTPSFAAPQPSPVLNVSKAGANLLFSWSSSNPNFGLFTNSDLSLPAASFAGISINSDATLTNWSATLPMPTNTALFFRLGLAAH